MQTKEDTRADKTLELALEKALERIERINRENHSLKEQVRYYKRILSKQQAMDRSERIRYFREQYHDIGRFLYLWIMARQQGLTDKEWLKQAGLLLDKVSGGADNLGNLVNSINHTFGNVLVHLTDEYPRLGPANFKLFCYLAIGFDHDLIVELLGFSEKQSVYSRKCRMRKMFKASNSPYREIYLDLT